MPATMSKLAARKRPEDSERRRIARHLLEHGAVPGDELAAALGMKAGWFWRMIDYDTWFKITGRGWAITAKARVEVQ